MTGRRTYNDWCGIARALDVIGERWALLVVRELLLGPKRFTDLRAGLPGISPDVLAQRLRELEAADVVRRATLPPPAATRVYELTEHGAALRPVLVALGRWGSAAPLPPAEATFGPDAMVLALVTMFDASVAGDLDATYEVVLDGQRFAVRVTAGELTTDRVAGPVTAELVVDTDPKTLAALLWRGLVRRGGRGGRNAASRRRPRRLPPPLRPLPHLTPTRPPLNRPNTPGGSNSDAMRPSSTLRGCRSVGNGVERRPRCQVDCRDAHRAGRPRDAESRGRRAGGADHPGELAIEPTRCDATERRGAPAARQARPRRRPQSSDVAGPRRRRPAGRPRLPGGLALGQPAAGLLRLRGRAGRPGAGRRHRAARDASVDLAKELGRTSLVSFTIAGSAAASLLGSERLRGRHATAQRRLDVADLDYGHIAALAADAADMATDYELVRLDGPAARGHAAQPHHAVRGDQRRTDRRSSPSSPTRSRSSGYGGTTSPCSKRRQQRLPADGPSSPYRRMGRSHDPLRRRRTGRATPCRRTPASSVTIADTGSACG